MSEGLLRLVYVSTATAAMDEAARRSILDHATARNSSEGVTGVLCAGSSHCLQVLEGSVRPVMSLYLRIMADPRHRDPTLLSISLVAERLFGQWAMAYIESSAHSTFAHDMLLSDRFLDAKNDRAADILRRFVAELKGKH
jgi:hypothetical protein